MILIEVEVPVIQKHFEFKVDENRPINDIIGEMRQVISKKLREEEPPSAFELHSGEQERRLPVEKTLSGCEIREGAKLILL